jgi:rare lipoprotein A
MRRRLLLCIAGAAMLGAAGCTGTGPRAPAGTALSALTPTVPSAPAFRETGLASWYGRELHGKVTASGTVFDMNGISAAHRTLPLGTIVRVTNLENYKSITVPVTDRGPFLKDQVVDLSYGAARELGFVEQGTAQVRVETDRPVPEEGTWTVLAASFAEEENANVLRYRLSQRYQVISITAFKYNIGTFYRVLVGNYPTEEKAERIAAKLKLEGLEPLVLRRD